MLLILARIIGIEGERVKGDKGRYRNREQAIGSCDPHGYQILVGGSKVLCTLGVAGHHGKEEESGQRENSHYVGLRGWYQLEGVMVDAGGN